MNKILFFYLLLFISNISYSQDEMEDYASIYKTADSLKKSGHLLDIDNSIFEKAKELDKQHPSKFFEATAEYINKSKFNEAAFLYYTGLMRYRYYNSVNPDYQASGDGALLASFKYTIGEPINMYLRTDVDNFLSIVKKVTDYYESNDFTFYSKSKDSEKYMKPLTSYREVITEIEKNKAKYTTEWEAERKKMEEMLKK